MGAAAIISLLGAVLPGAIQVAQKLFGSITGSAKAANDAAKLSIVAATVTPLLQALETAGKTPGAVLPTDVKAAIEAVLAAMKAIGAVPANNPTAAPGASDPSQTMKISGTLTLG